MIYKRSWHQTKYLRTWFLTQEHWYSEYFTYTILLSTLSLGQNTWKRRAKTGFGSQLQSMVGWLLCCGPTARQSIVEVQAWRSKELTSRQPGSTGYGSQGLGVRTWSEEWHVVNNALGLNYEWLQEKRQRNFYLKCILFPSLFLDVIPCLLC